MNIKQIEITRLVKNKGQIEGVPKNLYFICKTCNKKFYIKKYYINKNPKYCSRKCYANREITQSWKDKLSNAKKGKEPYNKLKRIITKCLNCNNNITNREGAKYQKKYCSLDCRNKGYKKGLSIKKNKFFLKNVIQICSFCKKEFKNKQKRKFCSKRCYSNSMKKYKFCLFCNKEIENKHSVSLKHRKYCSIKCRINAKKGMKLNEKWRNSISEARKNSLKCKGKNLYNWKGGIKTIKDRIKIYRHNRRDKIKLKLDILFIKALLISQKNKCFYCEKEFNNKNNYAIEHLTPISKGGDNQNFNLVLSCRSCNSKKNNKIFEDYSISNNLNWAFKWEYIYSNALLIKDRLVENTTKYY